MNRKKIVCFLCNWIFCNDRDTVIGDELDTKCDLRTVRVACLGRIDPVIILEVFADGAEGVLMQGCSPPDCHFLEGNLYAEKAFELLKRLLSLSGLDSKRLQLHWSSPHSDETFERILANFVFQIDELGASPVAGDKPDEKLLTNLRAAKNAASDFRWRVLSARERDLTENTNVYREKVPQETFDLLIDEIAEAEFVRQRILLLARERPLSVKHIAQAIGHKPELVLRHIVEMKRRRLIALDHVEETTPFYKALEVQ